MWLSDWLSKSESNVKQSCIKLVLPIENWESAWAHSIAKIQHSNSNFANKNMKMVLQTSTTLPYCDREVCNHFAGHSLAPICPFQIGFLHSKGKNNKLEQLQKQHKLYVPMPTLSRMLWVDLKIFGYFSSKNHVLHNTKWSQSLECHSIDTTNQAKVVKLPTKCGPANSVASQWSSASRTDSLYTVHWRKSMLDWNKIALSQCEQVDDCWISQW